MNTKFIIVFHYLHIFEKYQRGHLRMKFCMTNEHRKIQETRNKCFWSDKRDTTICQKKIDKDQ